MSIYFDNRQEDVIDSKTNELIETAIFEVLNYFDLDKYGLEISVSYVDEEEIKNLNSTYRDKNQITDVLSFPMLESFDNLKNGDMLGDVVLCVKRAKEQAREFNHSFTREIIYLTVHSILHLLGYDHIDEIDKKEMRLLEKTIMKNLSIFKAKEETKNEKR